MPTMPRFNKKATRLAYKILGIPANIAYKTSEKEKKINKQVQAGETRLVR